jgi:hypothetical protein
MFGRMTSSRIARMMERRFGCCVLLTSSAVRAGNPCRAEAQGDQCHRLAWNRPARAKLFESKRLNQCGGISS